MSILKRTRFLLAYSILAVICLSGCSSKSDSSGGNPTAPTPPPPEVSVIITTPKNIQLLATFPGRLQSTRTAEIRARVEGIVQKRLFREGSDVSVGAQLFLIDRIPLEVSYTAAQANLAKAAAALLPAKQKAERYKELLNAQAVTPQANDEAQAFFKQAEAEFAFAKASVAKAKLDLGYATVTAPITGRIGRALVSEGALVGKGEASHLATIEQIDPIYVNFTQPSLQALQFKQALGEKGKTDSGGVETNVKLYLEDNTIYPLTGKLLFSELAVDPSTGEISLRAEFPNPKHELLPGMYVRIEVHQGSLHQAITVPQQALIRNAQGASVLMVNDKNQIAVQPVETGKAQDNQWVITKGLQGGEKIIVEGLAKLRPGMTVKPVVVSQNPMDEKKPPEKTASTQIQ